MEKNKDEAPEKFSDDPEENTKLENEFLQMKIMAESGGIFGEFDNDLPPEVMNQWLKNIVEFEKNYADGKEVKLRESLGNPVYKDESGLDDTKFNAAYQKLNQLLEEHHIQVNFLRERDDRFRYNFITKELFDHETSFAPVPGMTTNYIYEEFHPDHEMEITNRTNEFFDSFFKRRLGDIENPYFEGEFILPDGNILPAEEMLKRFETMYEAIPEFENTSFEVEKIDFELKVKSEEEDAEETGMGYSEGTVRYDMIFKNGDKKKINGPFKIYFGMEWDWWSIYFFYLAGFNLMPKDKNSSE